MLIGKPDFRELTLTANQFVAIAAAVFFFIVEPVQAMLDRQRHEPIEEGMLDEERRHQELLVTLREARAG